MSRIKEEVIAVFNVKDKTDSTKEIFICQETQKEYNGSEAYTKKFRLDSVKGAVVHITSDPGVFQMQNGETLRRTKR